MAVKWRRWLNLDEGMTGSVALTMSEGAVEMAIGDCSNHINLWFYNYHDTEDVVKKVEYQNNNAHKLRAIRDALSLIENHLEQYGGLPRRGAPKKAKAGRR